MTDFSDKELVSGCKQGERLYIDALVKTYYTKVCSLCHKMIHDPDEAKDLTQETFIRVFDKFPQFKFKSSLKTWILSIAYNMCINRLNASNFRHHVAFDLEIHNLEDINESEYAIINEQRIEVIEQALKSLNTEEKLLIELHYLNECSIKEIAQIMEKTETAAKTGLFRARQKIKALVLKQDNYEFN